MRIIYLILSFLFITTVSASDLELEPGLWEVRVNMDMGGQKMDMTKMAKELAKTIPKESLEKLPKEARAELEKVLAQKDEVPRNCITKEMLKDPSKMKFSDRPDCDYKITKQTSSEMKMTFSCKDGASGEMHMKTKGKKAYTIDAKGSDKTGVKLSFTVEGKFIQTKCD